MANRTLRVLNVEDSERDVALLTRHLSRAGFELISERVETPAAMRAALESREWDVILCDYSMPHFNALSALALLKETGLDIPFIIISGTVGEELAVEAMRAGAHDYLMKDKLARLAPTIEREMQEAGNRRARRRAEAELRRSEEQYRRLIDTAYEGIWIADAKAKLTYANQRLAEMLGYTVEEIIGRSVFEVLDEAAREEMKAKWQRRVQGVEEQYDLRLRRKDGTHLWVILSATPIRDEQGEVTGALAMLTDITERKRAEQLIRLQATALQSAANAILITDDGGVISWVNPAFTSLTGYTLEEVSGRSPNILKSGKHDAAFYKTLWDTILSGHVFHGEMINRRKDGSLYFEEQTITPVMNEAGEIIHFVAVKQDVTERKRAEEERMRLGAEIESQRQRLNKIVANVPGVVWETSGVPNAATQSIDFVSGYVETMIGYSVEEWLSTPNFWLTIVHPEDRERTARAAAEAFSRGEEGILEFRWVAKDGRVVCVESHSAVITDDEGNPVGVRGVTIDVTERKRAEAALRESEERYRLMFEANPHPMWVYDLETLRFLAVNEAAVRHYGYSREEFMAITIKDIRPPQDVPALIENVAELTGGLDVAGVWRHRKKDSSLIEVEVTGHELVFAGRRAEVVLANDITARKRAEAALREAEEKYRSIFENAVEGIFQSTLDGRFISVNPAMIRILGYESAEELLAHRTDIGTQHYADPNTRAELMRMIAEHGVVVGYECEVFRKDGSRIWTAENVRAVRGEGGAVLYYEGSIEDITERKMLEEQLRQAQRLEAVGLLAGGIAHDFNNLLTVVTGYSDLALRRLREEDPLHRNVSEIKKAAERAAALTRQLLAFSRKQILQPKVLDLNAVISELEKMLRRLIGEDVELRTALAPDLGSVKADPGQIEQVVMNLAVNARDAMPGGGKMTIETENVYLDEGYASRHIGVSPGPYVMIAVSDTGTGMDARTRARIFEPFFTTKELGKGTGLGLSTVYGIVKQSGGNVWVYSEVGRGTTFKVYLPRAGEDVQEYKRSAEVEEAVRGTETVLLAEDEEVVRKLAREVLEAYGYPVLEAANGGAALLLCERHEGPIHLLLTDVVMPEMSGRELADRLGALRPEMKVLYMSGYTDNAIVHQGVLDEGANFIQKPFAPQQLASKVREVLDEEVRRG